MASKRFLSEESIVRFLLEEEDVSALGGSSDSELEDNVEVDDVDSDTVDDSFYKEDNSLNTQKRSCVVLLNDALEPQAFPVQSLESSSSNPYILKLPRSNIRSRSLHVWATSKGGSSKRTAAMNIVHVARGPARGVKNITDPLILFEHFMTDQIIKEIVKWTNSEIAIKKQNYGQNKFTQSETTKVEIRALIGILVLSAALKDNHLTLDELFNIEYSGTRYLSCMSKERCDFLLRCLRFDDKTLRLQRQKDDPFIPIRYIWELLIAQCRQNYIPGTNVTIDEQLLAFRGRCQFRMYIPNKPAKYGVKLVMMCDSGTRYMLDCMPYLGKGTDTGGLPLGEYFVKELTRSIHGTNRNVTIDNWFTSIPLAKHLLQQPYKLTIVGTLRANKKEIPEEVKNNRSRNVNTSIFCYDGPLTLLSYKPKPSKMVYLLSSCDEEGSVNFKTKKPSMVEFYNSTKGGVDTFDQMCSVMSCNRKTNRWPMCVFYGMINIACINSYIIYCHNASVLGQAIITRREFMKQLHSKLVEPRLKTRLEILTMPRHIKDNILYILNEKNVESHDRSQQSSSNDSNLVEERNINKRKICNLCSYKKRRMTKSSCSKCKIAICGEHKVDFCTQCASKN